MTRPVKSAKWSCPYRNGDTIRVSQDFPDCLAKINIHTKKLTGYKLPALCRYASGPEPVIDRNHMVRQSMTKQDALGRFNPVTEKFTLYPIPTRGISGRHIGVDHKPRSRKFGFPAMRRVAR
jgi:streptogramin lyase